MRKYKRLTIDERRIIEILYNKGMSINKISLTLGRSYSSIYDEVKKGLYNHLNTDYTYSRKYSAEKAQRVTDYNNTAKGAELKVGNDFEYISFVEKMILEKYSPQAVIGYIIDNKLSFKTQINSYTTLYSYIDKGVFPNITNRDLLRRKDKKEPRKPKVQRQPRGTSIDVRPLSVLARSDFGHWEMDTVIGKREKGEILLVLTERKTRYEIILRCKDKTAKSVVRHINALERQYGALFPLVFKSITVDNGSEFSSYKMIERRGRTIRMAIINLCSSSAFNHFI